MSRGSILVVGQPNPPSNFHFWGGRGAPPRREPHPHSRGTMRSMLGPARVRARYLESLPPAVRRGVAKLGSGGPVAVAAADLEPADWKAKFDAIKLCPDGSTPERGELSRVARLPPTVAKETLRRRFAARDVAVTKMGPPPTLGVLEKDLVEWLQAYKDMGVHIYVKIVCDKARRLAKAAGIEWDFVASDVWLKAFCARHDLKIREGQFLEKERAHAVTREGLGRFYDVLEVASTGVAPEDKWMLDEVHVNLLDTGGFKVSGATARAPSPARPYPLPTGPHIRRRGLRVYSQARLVQARLVYAVRQCARAGIYPRARLPGQARHGQVYQRVP
jgi:hypothetical protein